jgi:hypothetical protein
MKKEPKQTEKDIKLVNNMNVQSVLRIWIRDPVVFLPPGSGMEQWSDPDPGSGLSIQNLLKAFIQK